MPARPARAALAIAAAAVSLTACTSSPSGHPHGAPAPVANRPSPTTPPPTGAPTTTPPTHPPVSVYRPAAPQTSPSQAASALVARWAAGDRAGAAAVAAPPAVATLFAQPFPGSYIQSRGCTDATADPGTCTYANRASGSLYEIEVTRVGPGWYVSAVTAES